MSFPRIERRDVIRVIQGIEARVTSLFRRGAELRMPDLFSNWRRKFAEFKRQFTPEQMTTIVAPGQTQAYVSTRPPPTRDPEQSTDPYPRPTTDLDAKLAALDRVWIQPRQQPVEQPIAARAPEAPAADAAMIVQEKAAEVAQTLEDGFAKVAAAIGDLVDTVVEKAGEIGGAIQAQASALAGTASTTLESLKGPPDPTPPPRPEPSTSILAKEERQTAKDSIEPHAEKSRIGLAEWEELKPSKVEHRQPAIKRWYDKPRQEPVLFDGKAARAVEETKKKTTGEQAPEPSHLAPFTNEELEQAQRLVRGAKEAADADRLKEQERQFADLPTPATMKRMQKFEPKPRPTFDPTRAKKFEDWSDPAKENTAHGTVIEAEWPEIDKAGLARLTAEIHKLTASITASAPSPEAGPTRRSLQRRAHAADLRKRETKTEKPQEKLSRSSQDAAAPPEPAPAPNSAPTRGPLRKRRRVADLRRRETQTDKTQPEDLRDKLSRLSGEAAKRQPRRNKALKQALIEGTRTSQELAAGKPLQASPLERFRLVSGPPRHVRFGDLVEEREIKNSAEERNLKRRTLAQIDARTPQNDAGEILRTVHKEMRSRIVKGDRFINLMLIALDNTELPPQRQTDPDRMAIELYRAFSEEAPDRWAEQAESTIRVQLEARSREGALRALEPIVKYFDRYSRPPSENDRPGMQFLHERLGQLGKILHKLQAEQISRTDKEMPLTPPDSRTSL